MILAAFVLVLEDRPTDYDSPLITENVFPETKGTDKDRNDRLAEEQTGKENSKSLEDEQVSNDEIWEKVSPIATSEHVLLRLVACNPNLVDVKIKTTSFSRGFKHYETAVEVFY